MGSRKRKLPKKDKDGKLGIRVRFIEEMYILLLEDARKHYRKPTEHIECIVSNALLKSIENTKNAKGPQFAVIENIDCNNSNNSSDIDSVNTDSYDDDTDETINEEQVDINEDEPIESETAISSDNNVNEMSTSKKTKKGVEIPTRVATF